jgi:hypothetical protein
MIIARNGSVSDRLWRLVLGGDGDGDAYGDGDGGGVVDAGWLGEMPARVWGIVRDSVLRCT